LLVAGGAGRFTGEALVDHFEQDVNAPPVPPTFQSPVIRTQQQGPIGDVADIIYFGGSSWTPTGRFQPGLSVILSPRVKVHVSSGFHYPGTTYFSLRATYFFPRATP
jgi:hypothetical protein